jgi:hypothetical protein
VTVVVRKPKAAPLSHKTAKTCFAAAVCNSFRLMTQMWLATSNKIRKGELLSPRLLVSGHAPSDVE